MGVLFPTVQICSARTVFRLNKPTHVLRLANPHGRAHVIAACDIRLRFTRPRLQICCEPFTGSKALGKDCFSSETSFCVALGFQFEVTPIVSYLIITQPRRQHRTFSRTVTMCDSRKAWLLAVSLRCSIVRLPL